jgi:hypothetical protein
MNQLTKYLSIRALGVAAAVAFAALVAAACSQSGNPLAGPSGVAGGSLAVQPGGDTCPAGDSVKVDASNENTVSYTVTSPDIITAVCIKAGQTTGLFIDTNGTYNNCYTVTGLGGTTVTVTRIGSGPDCQGISHVRFYTEKKEEPPPPSKEICDNKIDDDGDTLVDEADPDCKL